MGENVKIEEQHSKAYALREQIRHTESDITQTVHTLEERLSPRYLGRQGIRKVEGLAWEGVARLLNLAQRTSVQVSLVGAGAAWILLRTTGLPDRIRGKRPALLRAKSSLLSERHQAGTAAKAARTGALWMMLRQGKAWEETAVRKPALSGLVLAATAAKAFLTGARASVKKGTARPGRKVAWRGLATAIGASLGSYWYSHKGHRV